MIKIRGIGIGKENLEGSFDRFERGKLPQAPGRPGLRLHISRQIVEAHDGSIRAESELGKGSTFTVELPKA